MIVLLNIYMKVVLGRYYGDNYKKVLYSYNNLSFSEYEEKIKNANYNNQYYELLFLALLKLKEFHRGNNKSYC